MPAAHSGLETRIPPWRGEQSWLCVQRHPPLRMAETHWHSHIEINYLADCAMVYVSNGRRVCLPSHRIMLFWASIPHQVIEIYGDGLLTCLYVSLQEFMSWRLPVRFCHEVMHGGFLLDSEQGTADGAAFDRWLWDYQRRDEGYQRQALDEVQLRLRRMALSGWRLANREHAPIRSAGGHPARGMARVEAMATFIAEHYAESIGVNEVAAHVDLHPNYATTLFKQVVGLPIAAYVTRHRLSHAQAMLLDTDRKILAIAMDCGFGSLSRFYEAFHACLDCTPRQYREAWRGR